MGLIRGLRHYALTGGATAADIRFHEVVLGLRTVRREHTTVRGRPAWRHLYGTGVELTDGFVSTYCPDTDVASGRRGSNGPRSVNMAVPRGSLDFWQQHLVEAHIEAERTTALDTERLDFTHPTGAFYSLVECDGDRPLPADSAIDAQYGIRGLYSATVSLMDVRETHSFLVDVLGARHTMQDIAWGRYEFDDSADLPGIELLHEPYRAPGTWGYATGTAHHIALDCGGVDNRKELVENLKEAGYNDISANHSGDASCPVWVRIPGGTLVALH